MNVLAREARETGRDYALRVLTHNIIHLGLAPGQKMSENELAAQLGLSRTPVREALMALAKVRLVQVHPQRCSTVSLIDYNLVEEARFLRGVLECAVAELACAQASPGEVQELTQNVVLQEYCLSRSASEKLWTLDNEFHRLIFLMARKEQTFRMLEGFTIHFDRVRNMSLSAVRDNKTVADHRAIAQAISARDAPLARRLLETHLSRYKVDEQALRERYPAAYFCASPS